MRLVQIQRHRNRHDIRDLTVAIRFEGDYERSYTAGDNSDVLPTDTMKNTVYALAARDGVQDPESFGLLLARHFLDRNARLVRVRIDVTEHPWSRLAHGDRDYGHAFVRAASEGRTAAIHAHRKRTLVGGGVADLMILKSSGSAFTGFPRDEFTTLSETRDRLLATSLTAAWRYATTDLDFRSTWHAVRQTLLDTFAEHQSESVQHTLHAMGQAVLDAIADVTAIRLTMPNKHHLPVDLRPFGLENRNEIFVPTEEPFGLIEATIVR